MLSVALSSLGRLLPAVSVCDTMLMLPPLTECSTAATLRGGEEATLKFPASRKKTRNQGMITDQQVIMLLLLTSEMKCSTVASSLPSPLP